jgi:predicted nucleic-acid-binding protein
MYAVDTNVIVRYLVNDDPGQARRARAVLDHEPTWIAKSVLLEAAWVLESVYERVWPDILDAFAALLGQPHVAVEAESAVARAIQWAREGMDFADALHLASAPESAQSFLTFDRPFARRRSVGVPVRLVPD